MHRRTARRATEADVPGIGRIGRPPAPMTHDDRALMTTARVWVIDGDQGLAAVLVTVPQPDHLLLDTNAAMTENLTKSVPRT
ncbi:hypothetical protein ACN27E_16795 [Mycobacterium sp. WMMD1722]|uniref:hypothetical protein n=1 Tax=Mycobacterium sp. WMMD1722 TaxID=3404117 RepID=UPI003BF5688C